MWPHLAMRGATGVDRQIGQLADCVSADTSTCKTASQSKWTSEFAAWAK